MICEQNSEGVQMRSKRVVLTDTNALILLLRIAPEMFSDKRFGCIMPEYVYDEFIRNAEFKEKFPWRSQYKKYLMSEIPIAQAQKNIQFIHTLQTISLIVQTKKNYGLSKKDQEIVSVAIAFNFDFCTEDKNLSRFAQDEFGLKVFSALAMINMWLEDKLIKWNDNLHALLSEWNGRPQPRSQIRRFHDLTGYDYPW